MSEANCVYIIIATDMSDAEGFNICGVYSDKGRAEMLAKISMEHVAKEPLIPASTENDSEWDEWRVAHGKWIEDRLFIDCPLYHKYWVYEARIDKGTVD